MQPFRSLRRCRALDVAAYHGWPVLRAMPLLVIVASGCARQAMTETLPRVVLTESARANSAAGDSVRVVPVRVSSVPARGPITIRFRPLTADTSRGPAMYIVGGRTLGRRGDGSIDRDAARRELTRVDPRTISSIQVLRGESAVQRYGPAASDGVVLIEVITHAQRAKTGDP